MKKIGTTFLGVEFVSTVWLGVLQVSWESNQVANVIFIAVSVRAAYAIARCFSNKKT